jgi:ectoine hydroxylase-related dioxygenase (phytanoyl-CoA dioxygenase family)
MNKMALMEAPATPMLQSMPAGSPVDDICEIIKRDGGVILTGYLTPEQVRAFNEDIDEAIQACSPRSKSGAPQWKRDLVQDEDPAIWDGIADFTGRNTKRLENLVNLSRTLREEILDIDAFHAVGNALLVGTGIGTYWMDEAQLIEIGPDSPAQPLHRDHDAWPPVRQLGPDAPEVIVNFLIAMTDCTEENGATRVIPGSNRWNDFSEAATQEMSVPAEMKAGDVLVFSGKVVHGGGANRTKDFYRRALTVPLLIGYLTPLHATALSLDKELVRGLPTRVQRLLGFRSHWFGFSGATLWQMQGKDIGEYVGL